MARMLCGICTVLQRAGQNRDRYPSSYIRDVAGLPKWWEEHRQADAARGAREAQAKREQRRDEKEFERLKKKLNR